MKLLSLCSGIGGLEVGLGLAGFPPASVVSEIDPQASEVLSERFPVPNIGDWTQLDSFNGYDLISGGLPCQPVSESGKGKGELDSRYLYDDLTRILRSSDVRPALVLENVRGILFPRNAAAFWRFISSLADLGYMGRWEVVRASDAGAPHRRERWFCLAVHRENPLDGYPGSQRWHEGAGFGQSKTTKVRDDGSGNNDGGLASLRSSRFGPGVRRWEAITRPAPPPLHDRRLSPYYVEWLMGYPEGFVTDILSRRPALRVLGNSVCPQQAALAMELLQK